VVGKDFKDAFEEAVGHEHARGHHVHHSDALLGGDGLEDVLALGGGGGDARAFVLRVARVQDQDRNVFLDGRQERSRMQDFRTEIGQFGGFFKADVLDAARIRAEVGVGSHHAVNVCPDFNARGIQARANDSGAEVRSASAQRGGNAFMRSGDKAAHHRHKLPLEQRLKFFLQALIGFFKLRDGLAEGRIGDDAFTRINMGGRDIALGKSRGGNLG
jgi:hypothetical protein